LKNNINGQKTNAGADINKRKKYSKKMMIGGSVFGVIFIILFALVSYLQFLITTPNSENETKIAFTVEPGQGLEEISRNLDEKNLVKNRFAFALYLKYEGKSGSLMAGDYLLPQNLNMVQLADLITKGSVVSRRVTFPEGWTIEKMADRLEAEKIVSREDFLAATNQNYDHDFLKDKPSGRNLEGYLYPDTYEFGKNVTAEEVVKKMLDNFNLKFDENLRKKAQE